MARDRGDYTDEPPRRGSHGADDSTGRGERRGPAADVPNYLVPAILVTLCCGCWPAGVVAIVYAAQVNSKVAAGDTRGAIEASDTAKMWCWVAVGAGAVIWILSFGLAFAAQMAKMK